jgi:glycosyltransferase involved in cell wall biosynthesis
MPVYELLQKDGFQLVLVDNGSKDNTNNVIKSMTTKYSWVELAYVKENQGYGYGILQGLKKAKGEYIGWLHADLQIEPKYILSIIEELDKLKNPTQAFFRGRRRNRPFTDRFFTFGMSVFESIFLHTKLYDINAQPTLFHRSFYDKFINPPHDFSLDLYVYYLAKTYKLNIIRVNVVQKVRIEGTSSWNTGMKARIKLIKRTLEYSKKLKGNV